MRVISGSARSLKLKTIEGNGTRPTTDRIKETLFNMINDRMYDCRFLDLFSGSGAIGIEALSRGAREAVFVENNKKAVSCIKENLKFTKLIDRAQIIERNAESAVAGLSGRFDVIFMDPPYDNEYEKKMLELISKSDIADRDTLIIVEASLDTKMDYVKEYGYDIVKEKTYKTNKHIFIQKS